MSSERAGGLIAYCASKAGVDILTKYMGQELGKYNIRVNSVNPAAVYTNIYVASGDYTQEGYDKSLWTTGANYLVDGGKSI